MPSCANWWLQAITRLTPRLLEQVGLIRGYLAERVCQLAVAGDYQGNAEITWAWWADPWLPC